MPKRAGANTEAIQKIRLIASMPSLPPEWKSDPDIVGKRLHDYFALCEANDILPTISNLAPAFHCDRRTIQRIINGETSSALDVQQMFIQTKAILEAIMLDQGISGDSNTIACVFGLKALHGYEDTPKEPPIIQERQPNLSIDDLKKKYLESMVI